MGGSNCSRSIFFFFNDTATTEIYTLSLHDALPICNRPSSRCRSARQGAAAMASSSVAMPRSKKPSPRSEEHTSELQSRPHLVCRLLLEKKKQHQLQSVDVARTEFQVAVLLRRTFHY